MIKMVLAILYSSNFMKRVGIAELSTSVKLGIHNKHIIWLHTETAVCFKQDVDIVNVIDPAKIHFPSPRLVS